MIASKQISNAMLAVAASAMLAQSAVAQLNSPRLGSGISLYVDGGAEVAVLPVISETAGSNLLTYDFTANEIRFSAGVLEPSYDDPLFCFDMGSPNSPVSIEVQDPNGHVVIDSFELGTSLQYVLAAPSSLVVEPTLNQQCFYRSSQGVFGLFGQTNGAQGQPGDTISRDRFEPNLSMSLAFQGVPDFASPGQSVGYDLVLTNTGSGDLNEVALQELFPENLGVYAAALTGTQIGCTPTGGAVCPSVGASSFLRFKNSGGGVDIPAGGSLTFSIQRTIDASSITGEDIHLHAGAVADPVATGVPFAVDEAVITVIGQSAGLDVSSTEAVADGNDTATITVTVLDSSQNPVPNETVTFDSIVPATSITLPVSGVSDANGQVSFTAGTTTSADDYTASFSSGTLTGDGIVSFVAGPPAAMNATTTTANNVVADGDAVAEFAVTVLDAFGNVVPGAEATVSDTGALASTDVQPPSAFTDVDGNAFFTASTTNAGDYTVTFAVTGAGSDFANVTFTPGAFDSFAFVQQPTDTLVGQDISPAVTVELLDAFDNRLTNDSLTEVTLDLRSSSSVEFAGSAVVSEGLATFPNISVGSTGTYYLRATVPGLSLLFRDSSTFEVTAAP